MEPGFRGCLRLHHRHPPKARPRPHHRYQPMRNEQTRGRRVSVLDDFEAQLIVLRLRPIHGGPILLQLGLLVIEFLREVHLTHDWLAKVISMWGHRTSTARKARISSLFSSSSTLRFPHRSCTQRDEGHATKGEARRRSDMWGWGDAGGMRQRTRGEG